MNEKFLSWDDERRLDPKVKKEIDEVREVIYQTSMDFHNYIFPKYINNYKKYLWFVADRIPFLSGWQSNINYPMVSSAVDQMFANIFDFGYQIWISEEWLKDACIRAFDFRNVWKNTLKETAKEALITWKGYARDFFIKEEFKEKFFWQEIKSEIKMPSMQYISVFDVMYDRSKGIEKSSYKIVRTFVSWDNIKKKVLPLILANYSWEEHERITKKIDKNLKDFQLSFWSRFSMFDYNPVKSLTATTLWANSNNTQLQWDYYNLSACSDKKWLLAWYNTDTSMKEDSKNYFLNANKSTYELVEYYTNSEKYIFVNGNIIYFWPSVSNLSKIREVTFSNIPWTWNAMWMADKLTWHQDLQNTLWNAFVDNLKLLLWPMFKVTGNLPIGKDWKIDFKSFQAFRTNGSTDIEKVQLWVTDFAPVNFMQMNEAAAIKESWMDNYIAWGWWSIERTAAWVDLKFNQYKSKLTPLTDSIDQMMWNIMRSWILMFLKFFTKEELWKMNIEITEVYETNEQWKSKFKTFEVNWIDIKQIIDESNISFTYNSLDKITKEWARDTLIHNFQFIIQYMPQALNLEEMWKVFSWKDFDPLKVLVPWKQQQQLPQQWWGNPLEALMWWWQEEIPEEAPIEQQEWWEMSDEQLLQELQNIS